MEIKKLTVRQCIGCRRVHRKDELLRFIRSSSGRMEFDEHGKKQGRGFYLCPEADCFFNTYTNKRIRVGFFKNRDDVAALIKEVHEALLKLIEKDFITTTKMGYLIKDSIGEDLLQWDNHVLIVKGNPSEMKVHMNSGMPADFSAISLLPAAQMGHIMGYGVRNDYPMIDRLAKNLMKYGMLSSKGHVI